MAQTQIESQYPDLASQAYEIVHEVMEAVQKIAGKQFWSAPRKPLAGIEAAQHWQQKRGT
jgi:hypothetical protein